MLAVDTSSLVEFLKGSKGTDIELIERALDEKNLILPPIVLSEVLSDPKLSASIKKTLQNIPTLPLLDGFWVNAGYLRSQALAHKRKARLGDALITQFCIDHQIPLITRDKDFKTFQTHKNFKLILCET
jgi:predicted nucleic acid-binding protein